MRTLAILLMFALPESSGTLSVCVKDDRGAVPGATVSLLTPDDLSELAVVTTRRDGCAIVEGVDPHREYLVRARMAGFLVTETEVVPNGQSTQVEMQLIEPEWAPLVRVIADPGAWSGKYVSLTGFLVVEDDRGYLYPTREFWQSGDTINALGLLLRPTLAVELKRHNRSYVEVAGRFELPDSKTVAITAGFLIDVSRVTRSRR